MSIIIPANSAAGGGFEVANSARFNTASSDSLTRTQSASPTSATKGTLSFWIKRSLLGTAQYYMSTFQDSNNRVQSEFQADDTLRIIQKNSASTTINIITNRVFRDPNAWYHVVLAFDTTQGTDSNRVKLYINGVQETSFSTASYPSSGIDSFLTKGTSASLGAYNGSGDYTSGYFAEMVLIDGQQLDPTSFGEFDEDSGSWKAIDVSGLTFGTNGYYLDFEDSSALGNDAAGSNNFTANNLTAVDQSLDTCTNNACVWNPLRFWNRSGTLQKVSFDNGNLRAIFDDNGYNEYAFASIGVNTGKWFCEMKAEDITATGNTRIGVLNMDYTGTGNPGDQSTSVSYLADGQKRVGGSNSSYGASYANGDIIGIALDVTNNTVTFYKNGSSQGSISITADTLYTFYSEDYASSGNKEISANFISPAYAISSGNADGNGYGNFEYAVPSGYLSLCTKNLSEALS